MSFRISFGERLSGACRCQAEAITAELPDLGEMSLGTGVSDVQVRAEGAVQGSQAGGCSKLQLLGRGINKRQCGMQRQQLPPKGLAYLPKCLMRYRVMPGSRVRAGKQSHFPGAGMPRVGSTETSS